MFERFVSEQMFLDTHLICIYISTNSPVWNILQSFVFLTALIKDFYHWHNLVKGNLDYTQPLYLTASNKLWMQCFPQTKCISFDWRLRVGNFKGRIHVVESMESCVTKKTAECSFTTLDNYGSNYNHHHHLHRYSTMIVHIECFDCRIRSESISSISSCDHLQWSQELIDCFVASSY